MIFGLIFYAVITRKEETWDNVGIRGAKPIPAIDDNG